MKGTLEVLRYLYSLPVEAQISWFFFFFFRLDLLLKVDFSVIATLHTFILLYIILYKLAYINRCFVQMRQRTSR